MAEAQSDISLSVKSSKKEKNQNQYLYRKCMDFIQNFTKAAVVIAIIAILVYIIIQL